MSNQISNQIGFLSDQRRLNVAITRSRHCLIIVGDANTLTSDPLWSRLIIFMQQKKYFRIASTSFCLD